MDFDRAKMPSWWTRLWLHPKQDQPFPVEWTAMLERNCEFFQWLETDHRQLLEKRIRKFIADRNWEGCNGLEISDEIRVTIAAQACRMALGWRNDPFSALQTILVYPEPYIVKQQQVTAAGIVQEWSESRLGEAWHRGPVILVWSEVLIDSRGERPGRNVVVHEFAHVLDRENRDADGIPAMNSDGELREWIAVTERARRKVVRDYRHRGHSVIDDYGLTNAAEFFAVACEAYFEDPDELHTDLPDLFGVLDRYFQPDRTTLRS